MNRASAYAVSTPRGYVGKFRLVWRTEHFLVQRDGKPVFFDTAEKAECAAWRAKDKIEQPIMLRHGEKASVAISEADKLFPDLKPIRKNGKVIHVERKRRAA